uniref:Uncharacterized protein n=1 Tax=Rhizophora mucronata TaxID=61149 RepID=A0A2P2MMY2_RHIMU
MPVRYRKRLVDVTVPSQLNAKCRFALSPSQPLSLSLFFVLLPSPCLWPVLYPHSQKTWIPC